MLNSFSNKDEIKDFLLLNDLYFEVYTIRSTKSEKFIKTFKIDRMTKENDIQL